MPTKPLSELIAEAKAIRDARKEASEYRPHDKQTFWHKSQARVRAVFAGNRVGKSDFLANEYRFYAIGKHPHRTVPKPPNFCRLAVEDEENGLKSIILPKFRKYCRDEILRGGSWDSAYERGAMRLHFATGSVVQFNTFHQAQQGRGAQKFAGAELVLYGHDEHGPKEIWDESMVRLGAGRPAPDGLICYTPKLGITWEHDEIFERAEKGDPDYECFKASIWDNPYLDPVEVEKILRSIYDPETGVGDKDLRQVTEFGDWMHLGGMVYPMWSESIHFVPYDGDIVKRGTKTVWVDPHPRKPTCVNFFVVDRDERMYCYREMDIHDSPSRVWEQIRDVSRDNGEDIRWFGMDCHWDFDQTGTGVEEGKSIKRQFEEASGVRWKDSPSVPGSKWAGIVQVRTALEPSPTLGVASFSVMKTCPKTAREFERYQFKPQTVAARVRDRNETIDENDDHVTLCRYYVQSNPRYEGPKLKPRSAPIPDPVVDRVFARYGDDDSPSERRLFR